MTVTRRSGQKGFSLLEMLVAFSILAIALGILLNIFSSGVRAAVVAEEYTAAVQIAESLMARAGTELPLHQGQADGVEHDKYQWRLTIEPFELATDDLDTKAIPASLFLVTVSVSWGDEDQWADPRQRTVELTRLKITNKNL